MPKTYSAVWIHAVWTTKNRVPLIHSNYMVEFCTFIRKNTREKGMMVDMVNGVEDHLHCLFRMRPSQSISNIMQQIKGGSSYWINDRNYLNVQFNWQQGYGALSVSPRDVERIREYIKNQKEHHKKWKLEDELERFRYYDPDHE
jgi:REP element-mobilizing transposase RayT